MGNIQHQLQIPGSICTATVPARSIKNLVQLFCLALILALPAAAQTPPPPTFNRDIAPILYRSCAGCHRPGESAPFSLLSYEDAQTHAAKIADMTAKRAMPPWLPEKGHGDFANDPSLSDAEIKLIAEWVKDGAPQGSPSDAPPPPRFTEGWQLGPPDLILEASRAYTLPASGPDVFWNFIFSPNLATKRYVRAIEVRPGAAHVVHHANVLIDRNQSARSREASPGAGFPGMDVTIERNPFDFDSHFLFWKPGSPPWVEPDGLAWELDPGNDLILNAHFMSTSMHSGMPMEVKPSIGLYFTDKPPAKFPLLIELQQDAALDIPPGVHDFIVADDFQLPVDSDVLAVYPHAHYLGHVIEAYATLPEGQRKWLIRIPQWDPAWQAVFHYREPVFLPKGSVISMRWHFDNSGANPRNPNHPARRVRGGDQSTDEMAHLWLQLLPRGTGNNRRQLEEAFVQHRLKRNPDDYFAHLELGAMMISQLNPSGAIPDLRAAVRIEPKKAEGHNWLGLALGAVGRSGEAIGQFQIALELDPRYTNARYNLARAFTKSGQLNEAWKNFSQLVAAEPKDALLRNEFGELLLRMRLPAEALEQFEKAIALDPTLESAKVNREQALHQLPPL